MWILYVVMFLSHPNFIVLGGGESEVYTDQAVCEAVAIQVMDKNHKDIYATCLYHEED